MKELINQKTENHILPFLWMKGESQQTIAEYIGQIHQSHINAICIESRPHPDFLGPQWWDDVEMIIEELKKYDMKLWILDDSHFPTGYAGGAVKKNPQHRKKVLMHRHIEVLGPRLQAGIFTRIPAVSLLILCMNPTTAILKKSSEKPLSVFSVMNPDSAMRKG